MNGFLLAAGEGRHALHAQVSVSGDGVCVHLTGGAGPHIGSVALAEPRASLTGIGRSCTSSVLNRMGHKDEAFARALAERISRETGRVACVAAGVHVDNADAADLRLLTAAFQTLSDALLRRLTAPDGTEEADE